MLNNFLKKRKSEQGFTLVEFLVVLGLIFVLVAVIAMAAYKSTQRTRISKVKSEVMSIVAAAQSWASNKPTMFKNMTFKDLENSDLVSKDLVNSNYQDPWGGAYELTPAGNGGSFTVTINGVPNKSIAQDLADNLRPASLNQDSSVAADDNVKVTFR